MIKIEVEDYCHQCLEFEAQVRKPDIIYAGDKHYTTLGDTIVKCEHRERCHAIATELAKHIVNTNYGHGGACYIGKCGENGTIDKKE